MAAFPIHILVTALAGWVYRIEFLVHSATRGYIRRSCRVGGLEILFPWEKTL